MRTKTEIGNVSLYLFWSLLKIPRFFSITGNCKQKIWLKQLKAAPALDFSYFQHVSKLVTHHRKVLISCEIRTFSVLLRLISYLPFFLTQTLTPTGAGSGNRQTAQDRIFPIVCAALSCASVVTWA